MGLLFIELWKLYDQGGDPTGTGAGGESFGENLLKMSFQLMLFLIAIYFGNSKQRKKNTNGVNFSYFKLG